MRAPASAAERITARYIPAGYTARTFTTEDGKGTGIVYWKESPVMDGSKFYAMGYTGTSSHPAFNFSFKNRERMEGYITEYFQGIQDRQNRKNQEAEKRRSFVTTLKPGDIISESWGYDQTNINFYQVIEVNGKNTITIREIAATITESGNMSMSGYTVPRPGEFLNDSKPMIKRVQPGLSNGEYINIRSYSSGHLWDGKPLYCSWYG